MLVTTFRPRRYVVQVMHEDRAICSEPCADPDAAAVVAERLWAIFVENPT